MGNVCMTLKKCGLCRQVIRETEAAIRDVIFDVGGGIENVFCGSSGKDNISPITQNKTASINTQRTLRLSLCRKCSSRS